MAVGQSTVAAITNLLKTRYPQRKLRIGSYGDAAFWSTAGKDTDFGGNNTRISVNYGRTQGSNNFANALTNVTADDDAAFLVTRVTDYHICKMASEAILAGKGQENTIVNSLDKQMESARVSCKRSISQQLYRNGGGARGQVGSFAGAVITLLEANDVVLFEINHFVQLSAADGLSGAVRAGNSRITKVSRTAGTLTTGAVSWVTDIAAIANNDFIFRMGDFGTAAKGLAAWLPQTEPVGGDSFFGQDRSFDPTRLSGIRITADAGASKEDVLINAASLCARESAQPKECYLHNTDLRDIVKSQLGNKEYDIMKSEDGQLSIRCNVLQSDYGPIKLIMDPNVPRGTFKLLTMDTWKIGSLGGIPHIASDDGKTVERQTDADGIMWRLRSYWQLYTTDPGLNCTGTF